MDDVPYYNLKPTETPEWATSVMVLLGYRQEILHRVWLQAGTKHFVLWTFGKIKMAKDAWPSIIDPLPVYHPLDELYLEALKKAI